MVVSYRRMVFSYWAHFSPWFTPVLMIWRWLHCLAVESGTFPAGAVSRARWHFVHGSAKALRVFSHTQPIARVPQLAE